MTLSKILMCIFISYAPIHPMSIDQLLSIKDIEPQIINKIPRQDFPDMRLVCKKWAARGTDGQIKENWQFMPDTVEKRNDKIVKRYDHCSFVNKMLILFDLIKDDDNAVKWIVNRKPLAIRIKIDESWLNQPCVFSAAMLAKHYNKPEIARLLIEADHLYYNNENWKDVYHKLSIPKEIEDCLPHDGNHDNAHNFSFIPYVIAAHLDNHHDLEKCYHTTQPTTLGQNIIITVCLKYNSTNCFHFLLTDRAIKKYTKAIINQDRCFFFQTTIDYNQPKLAKKLIDKKLFYLNGHVGKASDKMNILDFYLQDEKYKNNTQAHDLLRTLGAKTWKQIDHEIRIREEQKMRQRQRMNR